MKEQAFYLHQHINDFDEFCTSALNWNMDYRQLETGQFSSELLIFANANIIFARAQLNRRMIQHGLPPQGLITIGLLTNPTINIHWRNIDISGDMLFVFPPEGELHSITQANFDVFVISLCEIKLNQLCVALELPEFSTLLKKNEVFCCNPAKLDAFRKYLLSIDNTLISGTDAIRSVH